MDDTIQQPSLAPVPHESVRQLFHDVMDIIGESESGTIFFIAVEQLYLDIAYEKNLERRLTGSREEKVLSGRTPRYYLCPLFQTRGITLRGQAGRGHKLFFSFDERRPNIESGTDDAIFASVGEERELLQAVGSRFRSNREAYNSLQWSLQSEILAIPRKLSGLTHLTNYVQLDAYAVSEWTPEV